MIRGQHDVLMIKDNEIELGAVLRHAQDAPHPSERSVTKDIKGKLNWAIKPFYVILRTVLAPLHIHSQLRFSVPPQ